MTPQTEILSRFAEIIFPSQLIQCSLSLSLSVSLSLSLSAIFLQGNNFSDILFDFLEDKVLQKWSLLLKKKSAPRGRQKKEKMAKLLPLQMYHFTLTSHKNNMHVIQLWIWLTAQETNALQKWVEAYVNMESDIQSTLDISKSKFILTELLGPVVQTNNVVS